MNQAQAERLTRTHLERQFPKVCRTCGRTYASLRDYLERTSHVGRPVSYDADVGDWRPRAPAGTLSYANCRCGSTLTLGSEGMPLLTLWQLMAWARGETRRRGIDMAHLLEEVRSRIDGQVLSAPATEPGAQSAAERLDAWRAAVVALYLTGIVVGAPVILGVWMAVRPDRALAPPVPAVSALWALCAAALLSSRRGTLGRGGVLAVIACGALSLPAVGLLPGPALVMLTGCVLVTTTYGLRWGLGLVAIDALEYLLVGALHWTATGAREDAFGMWIRAATFFALSTSLLLAAFSRLLESLERAWLEQESSMQRERVALEERRRLEEAARGAERLEALGRLAGGVALDFNDLLLVILSWTDTMGDADPKTCAEGVAQVRRAATRAASLTRQLLMFARKDAWVPKAVDIDGAVESMVETLRRLLPAGVTVTHERSPTPCVKVDEAALGQILVNLAVNAGDAMVEGGDLTLATRVVRASEQPPEASDPTSDHVVLRVADTGDGMDAATCARVFEPLFTTKRTGKGAGLGLASVYGLVQQAGGWIRVESEPGRGTTFTVGFPIAEAASSAPDPEDRVDPTAGRVLVVEDDEPVRHVVAMTLRAAGHEVTEAGNVADALLAMRSLGSEFHVLCADADAAGEPTQKLVDTFRERFRAAGVILCSERSTRELAKIGLTRMHGELLAKPFVGEELVSAVARHVADARGAAVHPQPPR